MYNGKMAKIGAAVLMALIMMMLSFTRTHARDVLFLGMINNKGESVYQDLERALRFEFSANPNVRLASELETERIIKEIDRLNRTRTELFVPPNAKIADGTIILRGFVEELKINSGRSWGLWGNVRGSMTIKLHFNELNGPVAYQGEFSAAAKTKKKNFTAAQRPEKTVHASAPDRQELVRQMQAEIVKKVSEFTTLFFKSLDTGPVHKREVESDVDAED